MKLKNISTALFSVCFSFVFSVTQAQEKKRIDGVIAVVGEHIILESDIDKGYIEAQSVGVDAKDQSRCFFLKALLDNKLLAHHAVQDSLVITDLEINDVIDRQTDKMVEYYGSMENTLKATNKKSFEDFRTYFYDIVKTNKQADAMQSSIKDNIQITPEEVRQYYNAIPVDELPLVGKQVELSEIVIKPEISKEETQKVIDRLNEIRQDVLVNGASFTSKVFAYTEDSGSRDSGGLFVMTKKDQFVKEFKEVAFSLKEGEISAPFKTEYGYHIILLEKIEGPRLTLRHILISPKPSDSAIIAAKEKAEKIRTSVLNNEMTFAEAALSLSDRDETRSNGGILTNDRTGDTKFELNTMEDRTLYSMISNLEVNEMSPVKLVSGQRGNTGQLYQIVQVTKKYEEHPADYTIDYMKIREVALGTKKKEALEKWVKENTKDTYIFISDEYKNCEYVNDWLQ